MKLNINKWKKKKHLTCKDAEYLTNSYNKPESTICTH